LLPLNKNIQLIQIILNIPTWKSSFTLQRHCTYKLEFSNCNYLFSQNIYLNLQFILSLLQSISQPQTYIYVTKGPIRLNISLYKIKFIWWTNHHITIFSFTWSKVCHHVTLPPTSISITPNLTSNFTNSFSHTNTHHVTQKTKILHNHLGLGFALAIHKVDANQIELPYQLSY